MDETDFLDDTAEFSDGPEMQVANSQDIIYSSSPESGRPGKKRRIDHVSDSSHDSDDDIIDEGDYDLPSNGLEESEAQKGKASKYLMHVPEYEESIETAFVTQLTQPNSSPSRIRGPRWRKKAPNSSPSPPLRLPTRLSPPILQHALPQAQQVQPQLQQTRVKTVMDEFDEDDPALAEAFLDSDIEELASRPAVTMYGNAPNSRQPLSRTKSTSFRQTTLFGQTAVEAPPTQSRVHNWPLVQRDEAATHHKLNVEAMKTWVYPTNLGKPRDYQFNIVQRGLYHNLLVALPTGLGKTFIAATVMLNWFRWTENAQIVFVAPTKPLVHQQVDACYNIVGIPRSETVMLTGNVSPDVRAEEWESKRVFFMTPQTLINDLKHGYADPKKIVLIVVDEAHRATGNYAYVEVVKFMRRFNSSFRVLALTATPGANIESVQKVIDGLDIARVEIRTELSLDIREYVHTRNVVLELFDNSDEINMCLELFAKAVKPVQDKLSSQNAFWTKDPTAITAFGLLQARKRWMGSDAGRKANQGIKGMVNTIFNVLSGLAHAVLLLKFHGIGPFYHKMRSFENDVSSGNNNGKYAKQIAYDEHFKKLMGTVRVWINNSDFVGHPKLAYLKGVILNHFMDAGEGVGRAGGRPPSETRIMVFAHYRDSAEEIARVLNRHGDIVRARVFVGQQASKGSEGMDQKTQLAVIKDFERGKYNVLVATSVGEEGLDIGEVDLIVCYDSSASPIRMLQRMGRTGRKRAGNIEVLLMRGKEENDFNKSRDSYEKMQAIIASGKDFTFHYDMSPRIVPREIDPVVDRCIVEIPIENTQPGPIDPMRRAKKGQKKRQKKFHKPENAQEGFLTANGKEVCLKQKRPKTEAKAKRPLPKLDNCIAPLLPLEDVVLTAEEDIELENRYLQVAGDESEIQYIYPPKLYTDPAAQRKLQPTIDVKHSRVTRMLTEAFEAMRKPGRDWTAPWKSPQVYNEMSDPDHFSIDKRETAPSRSKKKAKQAERSSTVRSSGTAPLEDEYDLYDGFVDDGELNVDTQVFNLDDKVIQMPKSKQHKQKAKEPEPPEPYWVSQKSVREDEDDFNDELPDFVMLVGGKKQAVASGFGRGGRRVVDEDSDE